MSGQPDPTSFPLREGGSIPRDLVAAHADDITRVYGASLDAIALMGGISIYELLMLLPPPVGVGAGSHRRHVCSMTLKQAMQVKTDAIAAFHVRREADAEAAMLAMMEAEPAGAL